jgi:hypothetical protein
MSFKIPAASKEFVLAPEGTHLAICNAIIDLGMQPGSKMYPQPKRRVYIRFEIPGEQVEYEKDGQTITGPMVVGATFTCSMGKKSKLRQFIEGWFAKPFPSDDAASDFDLTKLLGRACLVNIAHNVSGDRVFANIASASPPLKNMEIPKQHKPNLFFNTEEWDEKVYEALPEWIRKKIDARLEGTSGTTQATDDDIPW